MRTPGQAFDLRAALWDELRAAMDELEASRGEPRAVHRCRVRVKRARALARVGSAGAPGLADVFNDTARGVMRTMAPARDLAALAETARTMSRKTKPRGGAALDRVAESLEAVRVASPALNMEATRAGLKDLLALAMVWPEASARQIKRGAERVVRRARRARRRGFKAKHAGPRHEWRKREKDRFYAVLLLDDAWPCARRRKLGQRLGETLGEEHDVRLLLDRIEAAPSLAGEDKAPQRAVKALRRRCKRLARRADRIGWRLHARGA
ncbi:MAG: CHAD domain-containing protein [Vitreimonas sp.]